MIPFPGVPARGGIVVYRPGQSLVLPDEAIATCSVYVATVAHELGETAWDTVLTAAQRERYAQTVAPDPLVRPSEEFANHVMRGILAPHLVERIVTRAFLRELGLRL